MTILLIAKVLGIYLVVSGLFLLFKGKTVPMMLKDFFDHPAIVYLTGLLLVFLPAYVLLQKNIWDGSWRTVVTILLWVILLKGLAYIFVPQALHRMVNKKFLEAINLYGLVAVVAGIYLFFYLA